MYTESRNSTWWAALAALLAFWAPAAHAGPEGGDALLGRVAAKYAAARSLSAAFFFPRLGITTSGMSRLNNSRSSARVKPLSKLRLATLPAP